MIHKKADNKPRAHSGHARASRLLGSVVQAALPATPPEEPWRAKSKGKGKRKKLQ